MSREIDIEIEESGFEAAIAADKVVSTRWSIDVSELVSREVIKVIKDVAAWLGVKITHLEYSSPVGTSRLGTVYITLESTQKMAEAFHKEVLRRRN